MSEAATSVPGSRLTAGLAHSMNVRKVDINYSGDRALVRITNNGLSFNETRKIREFGWEIVGINPRHKFVSLKRADR